MAEGAPRLGLKSNTQGTLTLRNNLIDCTIFATFIIQCMHHSRDSLAMAPNLPTLSCRAITLKVGQSHPHGDICLSKRRKYYVATEGIIPVSLAVFCHGPKRRFTSITMNHAQHFRDIFGSIIQDTICGASISACSPRLLIIRLETLR